MRTLPFLLAVFFTLYIKTAVAQTPVDTNQAKIEYTSMEEALKNPEKVYRLNLSNQSVFLPKDAWSKFINLEYLSFRNDHLSQLPEEIGKLKNLKVLDLSGNDFKTLPTSFKQLTKLQILYLNNEKNFDLSKNLALIKDLPNLKSIYLENNALTALPKKFFQLQQVENVFLNENNFREIPREMKRLKNLKFIDFHDNKQLVIPPGFQPSGFGFKINF
jgi:Leucine-rich repeat (LRR) protein